MMGRDQTGTTSKSLFSTLCTSKKRARVFDSMEEEPLASQGGDSLPIIGEGGALLSLPKCNTWMAGQLSRNTWMAGQLSRIFLKPCSTCAVAMSHQWEGIAGKDPKLSSDLRRSTRGAFKVSC